jgi:hypothetical protein
MIFYKQNCGGADSLYRVEQVRAVIAHIAHIRFDFPSAHQFGRKRSQQVDGRLLRVTGFQPALIILRVKEDGHAIVKFGDDLVRIAGDDGEGFEDARSRIGVRVWFALVILLLRRQREESVRLFLRALTFRTAECAQSSSALRPRAGWPFSLMMEDQSEVGFPSRRTRTPYPLTRSWRLLPLSSFTNIAVVRPCGFPPSGGRYGPTLPRSDETVV